MLTNEKTFNDEIYKSILGTDYFVSNLGNVKSKNKKLSLFTTPAGYKSVGLHINKTKKTFLVHRLVAEAFIPNPNNKPEVNHINGVKDDNNVSNLEWVTAKENTYHKIHKLGINPSQWLDNSNRTGKNHPLSKLVQQRIGNVLIAEFYGTYEASRQTGVCQTNICSCCLGKTKSAGGYQWNYK